MHDVLLVLEKVNPNSQNPILSLVESAAAFRQRPISLVPWEMPDSTLYGAWLAGPDRDFIFFESHTAGIHQNHIICHELAHMLLGHKTVTIMEENYTDLVKSLHTLIKQQTETGAQEQPLNLVLMRTSASLHDIEQEREAEDVAVFMQSDLIQRAGLQALTLQVPTAPLWTDLASKLGFD